MSTRPPTGHCLDCAAPIEGPGRRCRRCHVIFTRRALREAAAPIPRLPRLPRTAWQGRLAPGLPAPDPAVYARPPAEPGGVEPHETREEAPGDHPARNPGCGGTPMP